MTFQHPLLKSDLGPHRPPRRKLLRRAALPALAAWLLSGCISMDLGGDAPAHVQWSLRDATVTPPTVLDKPWVEGLLLQARPSHAVADTLSIAFSRQADAYSFYQFASWTERPVRQLPRLLQQRLQARGVAQSVGMMGDPMRADWLLMVGVDQLHHELGATAGQARLVMTLELFDRRNRQKVATRRFEALRPVATENAAGAAQALSRAVAAAFDEALPWVESELQRAIQAP